MPIRTAIKQPAQYSVSHNDLDVEAKTRFVELNTFIEALGLQLEPVLKSPVAVPYQASSVLHTRMIDLQPRVAEDVLSRMEPDIAKAYTESRNHDGYKSANYLIRAERFNFKLCGFVQAMAPTIILQQKQQQNYIKIKRLYERLRGFTPNRKEILLSIEELKNENTKNFSKSEFLHYRFWFFDLDYNEDTSLEDVRAHCKHLGIDPYITAIVQTSKNHYHIYIKSEMIASKAHVSKWPISLSKVDYKKATNKSYLQKLSKKKPQKTGLDWFKVATRGIPSISRLENSPVPIPVEANRKVYCGDDVLHRKFLALWKEIALLLKSDPVVCNESRVAQLPGYRNPKTNFEVKLVFANSKAPVLTTLAAEKIVNKNQATVNELERKEQKSISSDHLTSSKKISSNTLVCIPSSPEEYCKLHGLTDKVVWDRNLNGTSNNMLILLSRFSHVYIDLKNSIQQKLYFDKIIRPYFASRYSKDIQKDIDLNGFFYRFKSICRHNENNNSIQSKIDINDLVDRFEDTLKNRLGEKHKLLTSTSHKKLRYLICENLAYHAKVGIKDSITCFYFSIPASILNREIHQYRKKLQVYIDLGIYIIDNKYKIPKRQKGRVIERGECKKHILLLPKQKSDETIQDTANAFTFVAQGDQILHKGINGSEEIPMVKEIQPYDYTNPDPSDYITGVLNSFETLKKTAFYDSYDSVGLEPTEAIDKKNLEEVVASFICIKKEYEDTIAVSKKEYTKFKKAMKTLNIDIDKFINWESNDPFFTTYFTPDFFQDTLEAKILDSVIAARLIVAEAKTNEIKRRNEAIESINKIFIYRTRVLNDTTDYSALKRTTSSDFYFLKRINQL